MHLLRASEESFFFSSSYLRRPDLPWFESPKFKEIITDMYSKEPDFFKHFFFRHISTKIPLELLVEIIEMLLKKFPGGKEFILSGIIPRHIPTMIIGILSVNYDDDLPLAAEIFFALKEVLNQGGSIIPRQSEEDQLGLLLMRFQNGPYHI